MSYTKPMPSYERINGQRIRCYMTTAANDGVRS